MPNSLTTYDSSESVSIRNFTAYRRQNPTKTSQITLEISGVQFDPDQHETVTRLASSLGNIRVIIQSPDVYVDHNELTVIYQILAEDGSSVVDLSNVDKLFLSIRTLEQSQPPSYCDTSEVDAKTGVPPRSCKYSLPLQWFSTQKNSYLFVQVIAEIAGKDVQSEIVRLILQGAASWTKPDELGMYALFAQSPKYSGDIITVPIYGNTKNYYMLYWMAMLDFNPNVLEYVSAQQGSSWDELTFILSDTEINQRGKLEIVGSASAVSENVKGQGLHLADVQFRVKNIAAGEYTSVLQLTAKTMTTSEPVVDFVSNTNRVGTLIDITGNTIDATLKVSDSVIVDVYAEIPNADLFNLAPMTATETHTIPTYAVYNNRQELKDFSCKLNFKKLFLRQ